TDTPAFVNALNGRDMRLTGSSIGIDAGYAETGVTVDAANDVRPIDIPSITDTGAGSVSYYDIGAYEYTTGSGSITPGDLNSDGHVNITDLSIMLSNWGTTNSTCDLNTNGSVDIFDLSILLSHYGS
ncbi:MAG TPA: dockerin type I domain-containing protein, partial [Candidatus Saccharimonadales bacterium]|nr:dockerin type I domain-containing protein [Candidatus Saccharimonadales bacterium]